MTKAEIEGDVGESTIGGEVEASFTTTGPYSHELGQGGRYKLGIVHGHWTELPCVLQLESLLHWQGVHQGSR